MTPLCPTPSSTCVNVTKNPSKQQSTTRYVTLALVGVWGGIGSMRGKERERKRNEEGKSEGGKEQGEKEN